MENFLKDVFQIESSDRDEAFKFVADAASNTAVVEAGKDMFTFLAMPHSAENIPAAPAGKRVMYCLSERYLKEFDEGGKLHFATIDDNVYPSEIWEEMEQTTGLVAIVNGIPYLVSEIAIPTMTMRASVSGEMTVHSHTFIRNLHICEGFFLNNANDCKVRMVYRSAMHNGVEVRKAFAFLGSQYSYIPQTVLNDAVETLEKEDSLGKPVFKGMAMDHDFTREVVEYPEAAEDIAEAVKKTGADITPFVSVTTSDIGWSSVLVRGGYRTGKGSKVTVSEIKIQHKGNVTAEDILAKADEQIFTPVRKFPEQLVELMGKKAANTRAVAVLLGKTKKACFKSFTKRQMETLEDIKESLNPALTYTGYDIAMMFIDGEQRFNDGASETAKADFEAALAKVPAYLLKEMP